MGPVDQGRDAGVEALQGAREVAGVDVLSPVQRGEGVEDGGPLRPGQIRESNRRMLAGLLREAGCEVVDYGTVTDDEAALESVVRFAADECDAIVTSGGVSMGDYDVVKAVLGRIADMTWMQIAIKPAKPFAFGTLAGKPIFGLPGNPVSSIVSFEMLARPSLRRMMGHRRLARPSLVAISDSDLRRRPDGKVHLVRVTGQRISPPSLSARSNLKPSKRAPPLKFGSLPLSTSQRQKMRVCERTKRPRRLMRSPPRPSWMKTMVGVRSRRLKKRRRLQPRMRGSEARPCCACEGATPNWSPGCASASRTRLVWKS